MVKETQLQLVSQIFRRYELNAKFNVAKGGSKEGFLKKLQICMKHYDYKDETKDVRGKVPISLIRIIFNLCCID